MRKALEYGLGDLFPVDREPGSSALTVAIALALPTACSAGQHIGRIAVEFGSIDAVQLI